MSVSRTNASFGCPKDVRFQCTRCAICCGDTESRMRHVLLLRGDAEAISRSVLKPVEAFATEVKGHEPYVYEMRKTDEEGKCFFLEGRNCGVYELRPLVCRFYPFELVTLKDGKHKFLCTEECPGIGKGTKLTTAFFENLFNRASAQLGTKKPREI